MDGNLPPFIGRGWSFPPRFSTGGREVQVVEGLEEINQAMDALLSTRLNERVMRRDFGCDLNRFIFQSLDLDLINQLSNEITNAFSRYDQRISIENIDITPDKKEPGRLTINIAYAIRGTNARSNYVFPFYLIEGTEL